MKRTQVSLDDCAGKTIQAVAGLFSTKLVTFTDGTFAHFKAAHGYEGSVELEDEAYDIGSSDVSHEACIAAGLYTAEELAHALQERDDKWRQNNEARERQQLAELQKKYGA